MAKFLSQRKRVHIEEYRLVFDTDPERGTGYSFPCTQEGRIDLSGFSDAELENYQTCVLLRVVPHVENQSFDYWEEAVIECEVCGGEVQLATFTNTCDHCLEAGVITDYNLSGQRLAPRSQWGEETGETASDILMGGSDYNY